MALLHKLTCNYGSICFYTTPRYVIINKYDVIIVGGGILGIAHAYHCLQSGLRVALVEKNPGPQDATVRNFGQIVPSGMNAKWQLYGRESLRIYLEIQRQFDITIRQQGSIYLASDEDELTLLEELMVINRQQDYPSVLLTKNECLRRYPGLKSDYVKAGLFFPEEVNLDPRTAAHRILQYCVNRGLVYLPNTLVKNCIRANGHVILSTAQEEFFHADKVFICSGTDFKLLYPKVFAESDLEIVKLQMMSTLPQPNLKIHGSILTGLTIRRYESFQECPSYLMIKAEREADDYAQEFGVHILFKQNMDGSVVIGDTHEYASVGDETSLGFDVTWSLNEFVLTEAKKIFDLETWQVNRSWLGFYTQSTKSDIYNQTIDDHIHLVTGIGGKGMTGSFGFARENISKLLPLKTQKI